MARTFIGETRREQLVRAAVAAIAELGAERASTVLIAERAGVSRGVLTHHFRDREELLEAVVADVYERARAQILPLVEAPDSPRESVLAFVAASVDFYATHADDMLALTEIFAARRRSGDVRHLAELEAVAALLRAGQEAGELRPFDVAVMAELVRSMLDGALLRVRAGADAAALRDELVAVVDRSTRSDP